MANAKMQEGIRPEKDLPLKGKKIKKPMPAEPVGPQAPP
jgi:hypothetical protein